MIEIRVGKIQWIIQNTVDGKNQNIKNTGDDRWGQGYQEKTARNKKQNNRKRIRIEQKRKGEDNIRGKEKIIKQ